MAELMNVQDDGATNALRDGIAYADQWLEYRCEFRNHPGLVVAIQKDDEIRLSNAYGMANLERHAPMTTRHIFRIASHSKTFTATAIMQLVQDGRVRLDDRLAAHLSWLSTSDATIRQTLNHASGVIRDGLDADFWRVEHDFPGLEQLRESASRQILEPNTLFKYSNIGYALLGLVIEAVTGQAYNDYVRQHIIQPLGLADTGPEVDPSLSDRLVTGYTRAHLGVPRRPMPLVIDTHALSPATGFYSTAEDLCRYARAHYMGEERLLTDASKREMQQPYWGIEQADGERYGLGLSVREIGKRRMVGHGGGFPGQSTRTLIDSHDRLVVVVFSNTSASDGLAAPLAEGVVKIIDFALSRAGAPATDVAAATYTGRYANLGGVLDIVAVGNGLFGISPEADDPTARVSELHVVDADTLKIEKTGGYGSPGELVRFERGADGHVQKVIWGGVGSYPVAAFRERYQTAQRTLVQA
ncbi:MAG: serine hydrolase [Chloroflexi bacterium]|nr:serine hydrolase [Chloroflexota bacterium]MBV9547725.1 serine hydrolase [Chloroflexota bacterium]